MDKHVNPHNRSPNRKAHSEAHVAATKHQLAESNPKAKLRDLPSPSAPPATSPPTSNEPSNAAIDQHHNLINLPAKHVNKNTVQFAEEPLVIPVAEMPETNFAIYECDGYPVDLRKKSNPSTFSDQEASQKREIKNAKLLVKKHPYHVEQIETSLTASQNAHRLDFALSTLSFNKQESIERLNFEDPIGKPPHEVDLFAFFDDPDKPKKRSSVSDNVSELLERYYQTDIYPPKNVPDEKNVIASHTQASKPSFERLTETVENRPDIKVCFEKVFDLSHDPADLPAILQTSVAKRKKNELEYFTLSIKSSSTQIIARTSEPVPRQKKHKLSITGERGPRNPSSDKLTGSSASNQTHTPVDSTGHLLPGKENINHHPHLGRIKEHSKTRQTDQPNVIPENVASGLDLSLKVPSMMLKTTTDGEGTAQGSRQEPAAVGGAVLSSSVIVNNGLPVVVGGEVSEQPKLPQSFKLAGTASWNKFFGQGFEDTHSTIVEEIDTGYATVRGPVGLRKQFLDDEKNIQFFRQLLEQLVKQYLSHSVPTVGKVQPGRSMKVNQINHAQPLTLEKILPIIRRSTTDSENRGKPVFDGATEAYVEELTDLLQTNFPAYDRGPQQAQFNVCDINYSKVDGGDAILQCKWFYNEDEPLMKTYHSQLYPFQNPNRKTFMSEERILHYSASMTSAKDFEHKSKNFPGVFGEKIESVFMSHKKGQELGAQYEHVLQESSKRFHDKLRHDRKHLHNSGIELHKKTPCTAVTALTFPSHRKPLLPRSNIAECRAFTVAVLRRLPGSYWPERMLQQKYKRKTDLIRPCYRAPTESWSTYVEIQAQLLHDVRKRSHQKAEYFTCQLQKACYCNKPSRRHVVTFKEYNKIRLRNLKKHSFHFVSKHYNFKLNYGCSHCKKLQAALATEPPQYKTGDLPPFLRNPSLGSTVWKALQEKAEIVSGRKPDATPDKEAEGATKPDSPHSSPSATVMSLSVPAITKDISSVIAIKSSANLPPHTHASMAHAAKQKKHLAPANNELPVPSPVTTLPKDVESKQLPPAVSVPLDTNKKSPGLLTGLESTTDANSNVSTEWEDEPKDDEAAYEKFTFLQLPANFRWSLLEVNNALDKLSEDTTEFTVADVVQGGKRQHQQNSVLAIQDAEQIQSSVQFLPILRTPNTDNQNLLLTEPLQLREQKEAEARLKRVKPPKELPRYMGNKHAKTVAKLQVAQDPTLKSMGELETKDDCLQLNRFLTNQSLDPMCELDLYFQLTKKTDSNPPFSDSGQSQKPEQGKEGDKIKAEMEVSNRMTEKPKMWSSACQSRSLSPKPISSKNAFIGRKLPGLSGEKLVHPRLQRSFILSPNQRNRKNLVQGFGPIVSQKNGSVKTLAECWKQSSTTAKGSNHPDRQGFMYKSTIKTIPRKAKIKHRASQNTDKVLLEPKPLETKDRSFIRMPAWQNTKSYGLFQFNQAKYGPKTTDKTPRNMFVLNDNFWRKKPPFAVALKTLVGQQILSNLRKYLKRRQNMDSETSPFNTVFDNFKAQSGAGTVLQPGKNMDELEFQSAHQKGSVTNKVRADLSSSLVDRTLKLRKVARLNDVFVSSEYDPIHQKLQFRESESISEKHKRLCNLWNHEKPSEFCNMDFVYQTPKRRALWVHMDRYKNRIHYARFIQNVTGSERYNRIQRSLLIQERYKQTQAESLTFQQPREGQDKLDAQKSAEHLLGNEIHRIPHSPQHSSRKPKREHETEEEDIPRNDVTSEKEKDTHASTKIKSSGQSSDPKIDVSAFNGTRAIKGHRELVHPFSTDGKVPVDTWSARNIQPQIIEQQPSPELSIQGQQKQAIVDPLWWRFNPEECFQDAILEPYESALPVSLFQSQIRLAQTHTNPVNFLVHQPTDQEHSRLGLIQLLKEKLAQDPLLANRIQQADGQRIALNVPIIPGHIGFVDDPDCPIAETIQKATDIFRTIAGNAGKTGLADNIHSTSISAGVSVFPSSLLDCESNLSAFVYNKCAENVNRQKFSNGREACGRLKTLIAMPHDFKWQSEEITRINKQVLRRCKYYDSCIEYLRSLMPQIGDEVILAKLQQLHILPGNQEKSEVRPRRVVQMKVLANWIHDHSYECACIPVDGPELFRLHLTKKILGLKLTQLHLLHIADKLIRTRQRAFIRENMGSWHAPIKFQMGQKLPCQTIIRKRQVYLTPPQSPPRYASPLKSNQKVVVDPPTDEEGAVKDKKGKGDKSEKGKTTKKPKDVKSEEGSSTKKSRLPVSSDNSGKVTQKNNDVKPKAK